MRFRKRIVRVAISFLSMFLSPEEAEELMEELRDIAKEQKE
tara:strand:- start:1447 stop:1569 length:123 start_codon:yes stop_codon:yes gene_type:complete